MYKLLKIFGLERCEHCGRIFTKWNGKSILQVYKKTVEIRWFCDEHAPDFDVCLNIYNSRFNYEDCFKFTVNPNNYKLFPADKEN